MMGEYKRILIGILALFTTLFAWSVCLSNAQKIQQLEDKAEIRYDTPKLEGKAVKKLREEEASQTNKIIKDALAWNETSGKKVINEGLNKETTGSIIEVYGNLSLLLPMDKLEGQLVYEGDYTGAIITETVAHALWGGTDVLGKSIVIGNKTYTVRGILKEDKPSLFIQRDVKDEEAKFSSLRVQMVDTDNIEEHIKTLELKYNLPKGVMINLSLSSIILSQLALLPGWLIGIYSLLKLYRLIYKKHHYWVSAILLTVLAMVITLGVIPILQLSLHIPNYMIPNKWSDFDFWSRTIDSMMQNREIIQSLPSYLPDRWNDVVTYNLIGSAVLALIGSVTLITVIRVKTGKELFWYTLIAISLSFMAIVILYSMGMEVMMTQAFWLIIPIYLSMEYIILKCKSWFV